MSLGNLSLYLMSLLYEKDGLCGITPLDLISKHQMEWEGEHSFSCIGWGCYTAVVHPDITAVPRVGAREHTQEKYLITIQSFRAESIFTYTEIPSNHIVLIHSKGTFWMLFRGLERLFKYLESFHFHLPLWFFRLCFQLV